MKTSERKGRPITSGRRSGIALVKDLLSGNIFSLPTSSPIGSVISFYRTAFKLSDWQVSTRWFPGRKRTGGLRRYEHPIPYVEEIPPRVEAPRDYVDAPGPIDQPVEEVPCTGGLIVASLKGYWNIELDDKYRLGSRLYWLGNNSAGKCIKDIIGNVERFSHDGFISSLPARWAFEDGKRKILMPTNYSLNAIFPYKTSTIWKNVRDWANLGDDTVFCHYGYSIDGYDRNGMRSCAFPGGLYGAMSYGWFAESYWALAIESQDYRQFDTTGMDVMVSGNQYPLGTEGSGQPYIRMIGLQKSFDCENPEISTGDIRARVLDLINKERSCEYGQPSLIDNDSDYQVALDYAQVMADNDWFNHVGPPPENTTLPERATAGGLTWELLSEVLAVAPDQPTIDEVADTIVAAWKGSDAHWDALMSDLYFRGSFAAIQNPTNLKWYACGIIRTIENDKYLYTFQTVKVAPPPPMLDGLIESDPYLFSPYYMMDAYRAFSTVPNKDLSIRNLTRQVFYGNMNIGSPWFVVMSDNKDWFSDSGPIEQGFGSPFNTVQAGDYIEYPSSIYGTNGSRIRGVNTDVKFIYQYNEADKEIYVILEPLSSDTTDLPDAYPTTPINQPVTTNRTDGGCSLYVGACLVDYSRRGRFHGAHQNPYQTLTVSSAFHSNSGYTVITYTVVETLYNDYLAWEYAGEDYRSRYYKLRQTLWCAVIFEETLIARWELKANNSDYSYDEEYPTELAQQTITQETPPTPLQQDFIFNLNKMIKPETVEIFCIVYDTRIFFTDDGQGSLVEEEFQIPETQFLIADSSIDYDTGTVTLSFGSYKPDASTDVVLKAEVSSEPIEYGSIEAVTEVHGYEFPDRPIAQVSQYQMTTFKTSGDFPGCVNATITEDGRYVVVSLSMFKLKAGTQGTRYVGSTVNSAKLGQSYNILHDRNPPQTTVFDLDPFTMDGLQPRIRTVPLYLVGETLTETVVLN